jgi:hypothetical protein
VFVTTFTGYECFGLVDGDEFEMERNNTAGSVKGVTMASVVIKHKAKLRRVYQECGNMDKHLNNIQRYVK